MHNLPDINQITPLGAADEKCLSEIREVLTRHNALSRFGVSLLHSHFAVGDEEILVETCDTLNRTLTITPQPKSSVAATRSIQTNWRLDSMNATQECTQVCSEDEDGHHTETHHL